MPELSAHRNKYPRALATTTTSQVLGTKPTTYWALKTMNSIPMLPVPYELLRLIFEHLESDKSSLCAVALCSSACCHEAQRILFRAVANDLIDPKRHLGFLRAVTTSPDHLALLVREYRTPRNGPLELFSLLMLGMNAMRNLKRLYADNRKFPRSINWASMLRGCVFNLEYFQLESNDRDADELFTTFLPLQYNLKYLSTWISGGKDLKPKWPANSVICPQLSSLTGRWGVIKAMLPEHKITTLRVCSGLPQFASDAEIISVIPALGFIKAMRYELNPTSPRDLEPILRHCTSLTLLEFEFRGWTFFKQEVYCMLPVVPSLRTLIISGNDRFGRREELQRLVRCIFDCYSINLQCIYVEVSQNEYLRYMRLQGDPAEQRVSENEVKGLWPNALGSI